MKSPGVTHEYAVSCIKTFKSFFLYKDKPLRYIEKYYPDDIYSLYNVAKQHETKTRNLYKALSFYIKAAANGQKINSCIKDFASVLHQCGYTSHAIGFLNDMKCIYSGDKTKYEKLMANLATQIKPTLKHEYKNILIDLISAKLEDP